MATAITRSKSKTSYEIKLFLYFGLKMLASGIREDNPALGGLDRNDLPVETVHLKRMLVHSTF